ncbi:acetoacetate--CoA ligase [Gordonia jinhuaensis]|uniref:Acetoacetyl-CoA synthetase n=1 Tax=Gordonia jinhuaensis TaxID=1517702 RepID=A0A916X282_9ACTN|nr:acetoacetate--CoA ligase [Gordonia jinhuaensis]GGB48281.1 acetoacetyl-CoA synthetase [Gordonia jinhuaensis]
MTVSQDATPESTPETTGPIWTPDPDTLAATQMTEFARLLGARAGRELVSYQDLWEYSVEDLAGFWSAIAEYFDVMVDDVPGDVLPEKSMPGARWFPGAHVNYAEHSLRHTGSATAVIAIDEAGHTDEVSWDRLRGMVGSVQEWLLAQGVERGDRVVGYLPNTLHALVGLLATTGLGAVWSACGQDYGAAGALARLGQLEPTVLIASDGYQWNGKHFDRRQEVAEVVAGIGSLRAVLRASVAGLWEHDDTPDLGVASADFDAVIAEPSEPRFVRVEFNDPLWVLFSSGTTGVPKGIVHSHGGVLLDHLRLLGLHIDLRAGERFFWYTTTNWMMWNLQVSGLLVGAAIVLYDGSPNKPGPQRLWEISADHHVTVLGVSPGYLVGSAKADLHPGSDYDLSALRVIGSTGAPLPAQCYVWVHDEVGKNIQLASTSGGTDVVSGFAGAAPNLPVHIGEISCPFLGVNMQSWDEDGHAMIGEVGELVITSPMPSMPIYFWNDPDGSRYHGAYFDTYPGVWRHGDWITITDNGGVVISGRSDATLNRHGVRLGSADIYDAVEDMPEIIESLVIGAELDGGHNGAGDYWMPLFVVLADGVELDDDLRKRISETIRTSASPRHVPDDVIAVPAIPHTRTGKKLEIPVKRLIQGRPLGKVIGVDTVDDPDALQYFVRFAREAGDPQ